MGEWNNTLVARKDFYKIAVFTPRPRRERRGHWRMCSRVYLGSLMYVSVISYCWCMRNDSASKEGYAWSWVARTTDKWRTQGATLDNAGWDESEAFSVGECVRLTPSAFAVARERALISSVVTRLPPPPPPAAYTLLRRCPPPRPPPTARRHLPPPPPCTPKTSTRPLNTSQQICPTPSHNNPVPLPSSSTMSASSRCSKTWTPAVSQTSGRSVFASKHVSRR